MLSSANHVDGRMRDLDHHAALRIRFASAQRGDGFLRSLGYRDNLSIQQCDAITLLKRLIVPRESSVNRLGDTQIAFFVAHGTILVVNRLCQLTALRP